MIKLYYSPQSCSLIPHILLEELGANYETQLVSLKDNMHKQPEFLKINPKGKIPIIQDNGKIITETIAIVNYIADLYPNDNIFPKKNLQKKSDIMEWICYYNNTLHTAFLRLFRPNHFTTDKQAYQKIQNLANQDIDSAFQNIDLLLKNHNYLNGTEFQLCDIFLFNYGRWGNLAAKPTKKYVNLANFMYRIAKRHAVKYVLQKEKIDLYRDLLPKIS